MTKEEKLDIIKELLKYRTKIKIAYNSKEWSYETWQALEKYLLEQELEKILNKIENK